jgi:hypothetical protein
VLQEAPSIDSTPTPGTFWPQVLPTHVIE